jgi:hypothetical protein
MWRGAHDPWARGRKEAWAGRWGDAPKERQPSPPEAGATPGHELERCAG